MVSAPRTAYVLFAPGTLTRCFDAFKRSESAIQIQMRPKIPLTPGIGHLLENPREISSFDTSSEVSAQLTKPTSLPR